jgi:hypothetical protein
MRLFEHICCANKIVNFMKSIHRSQIQCTSVNEYNMLPNQKKLLSHDNIAPVIMSRIIRIIVCTPRNGSETLYHYNHFMPSNNPR